MTHRNSDTEVDFAAMDLVYEFKVIDTVMGPLLVRQPKHKSSDQRIREAFDALRAEIEAVFGDQPDLTRADAIALNTAAYPARLIEYLECLQQDLLDFAKLPADA